MLTGSHKALFTLWDQQDVLLTRTDKGAGIVLLDKSDYVNKRQAFLADTTKFNEMTNQKDETLVRDTRITSSLKQLKDQEVITTVQHEPMWPTGNTILYRYGLPEIHKHNCPTCPIFDMKNSSYHATAQWLTEILEPVWGKKTVFIVCEILLNS
ncbi:uncharacterized protein DEA37_0002358 [Paragonimus westermani]|uniref:Uncharacterized protein n=1 Tax=Paragonimus westermani TaxID=34504 RepID=A0A5J4NKN9_9TREM|nr:uncharacterized protein DEA37_0002358 [Paragonimus westermani]